MTDPITLPGSIPGLLRTGSVVRVHVPDMIGSPLFGVVLVPDIGAGPRGREALVASSWFPTQRIPWADLALDLTDATGRAHAAWYVAQHFTANYHDFDDILGPGHYVAVVEADDGEDMDQEEIMALRRVVLHVAGLEVTR